MRRKEKQTLIRIIISAISLIAVALSARFNLLPTILLFDSIDVLSAVLFLIPYIVIGWDILWRAARNIVRGQIFDENFLMSLATLCAFVIGEYAEAVFVMLFYQVGELFQDMAVGKSRRSIKALLSIRADTAFLCHDNGENEEIACEDVKVGDIICVRPGDKVPLDGEIIEGATFLNTVALTGESLPREANIGDIALSGCVNESGFIKLRVTVPFKDSTVSKILRLVEESSANKSKSEKFITKFARIYTPCVVIGAFLLAVIPPLLISPTSTAQWQEWIMRAMTFLVISCPCALVISVPMAYFGGIGAASANGILIKGSNYLDALAKCDTAVFDKTGTLTEGDFKVTEIIPEKIGKNELLTLAALAEKHSAHPIALSLLSAAEEQGCHLTDTVSDIREIPGKGISARYGEKILLVGNRSLMADHGLTASNDNPIGSVVFVALDGEILGKIIISDTLRNDAKASLTLLKECGIKKTIMLSGDRDSEANAIASHLGVEYRAELLPADKVNEIEKIMCDSVGTLFVGDGINDAPVIARADVGIAMGGLGSQAAIEAVDIVLMNDDLKKLAYTVKLARRTRAIVMQNIIFALGIKLLALVLGSLGLVGLGAAVFADVGVAVIAILNSMRNLKK